MTVPAYKLAHVDITEITLAARKALMVADSHYFAWPAEQQERFFGAGYIFEINVSGLFGSPIDSFPS